MGRIRLGYDEIFYAEYNAKDVSCIIFCSFEYMGYILMKKILIYDNNFYPEISSLAQLYTDLSLELVKEYEVNVICAVPSYMGHIEKKYLERWLFKEVYKGIKIYRVKVFPFNKKNKISRSISILSYFIRAFFASLSIHNVDVILSVSQPPILGGMLGVITKAIKRCKLIYNIQDFNPEQIVAVGYSKNKLLLRLLLEVDKFSCSSADKIIVVGKDMIDTIQKRFKSKNRCMDTIFINNWVNQKKLFPLEKQDNGVLQFKQKYGLINKFVFMYSGNIGLIYDLDNIIKVIREFRGYDDVVFVFVGEGNRKSALQKYVENEKMNNVLFVPYQDNDKIIFSLNSADVHFVINVKGMKGVACPSKLYGIMAVGKPVLGVLEDGTEAKDIIINSQCGYVSEPGNYKEIKQLIERMYMEKESLEKFGENAREYLCTHLSRENSINKYKKVIADLI